MTDDDGGMRIIATNSEAELAARHALENLSWCLLELAANLLRIVRGAGRPEDLGLQMAEVLSLFNRHRDAAGAYPANYDILQAISLRSEGNARKHTDAWTHAIDRIVQGSLQVAASRLLDQSTQESAGQREMMQGIEAIEAIWEANRRRVRETRPSAPPFSQRKRGAKKKPVRRDDE